MFYDDEYGCLAVDAGDDPPPKRVEDMTDAELKPGFNPATCRECGCTGQTACVVILNEDGDLGGCCWVEPDLCSACAEGPQRQARASIRDLVQEARLHVNCVAEGVRDTSAFASAGRYLDCQKAAQGVDQQLAQARVFLHRAFEMIEQGYGTT